MEFLQRHLPRVYQAVQDAMNFLTNFTAQVFGAPPNAPQPRNARTNVPIQKESEGPPAPEETCAKKETDLLTSTPQLLGVTEENGDSAGGHPGDEDYRMQETDLRHRKSDPGGRRDLEHKITEDVDIVLHTTAEVTHSYQIKVTESTESKNIVQSIVNPEQVNPPDPLELKNKVLIGCEINVSQYEEELTSRAENLEDNEPLGNSEHKVYKGGQPTGEPSSDRQYEESLFQPITLQSLLFEDRKQLVGTTGQEEEEPIKSLMEITTERGEHNITTEQEALVLEESIDSTVTLEFDVDNILDVIENNKKLVTPVDEPESSSSQGGDSMKTLEDLLETANRLAKHCDLFQKVEGQKESDTLQDLDETLGSMPASILSTDLGYTEEDLTSVNVSVTKSNFLWEQSENQQTHLEEETIKTQSLVLGQSDRNLEKEGKEVSAKDVMKPTNKEDVQGIEEHLTKKQEEKHQFKGSERQPNTSRKQKIKRRVHFSPSTEDLFKKSERASRNTLQMVCDEILEGELQPREDREQLGSSYIIKDLGQSPSKEREGNYLGGTTCSYDSHYDGQSTSEEEETNGINEGPTNGMNKGQTVWYDNYSAQAEHDERCDSLETATDQNVHVDSKMEESFVTATDSRSTEEHLDHIPSSEETLSVETESSGNRDMSNINNEQTELFTENKNESHALRETMNKSEKESLAASDGTEDTVRKEDSFLEEEKCQVEYLLEEKKDLLECDPTHVKEFIDDIPQSSDTLDTKNVGLSIDFTDEQMKTDNLFPEKAILGQDFPTQDTQLENIIHYSAHRDITETASAENELTLGDCSIQETDKIIKSEQDGKEVQDETFLSEAKDVLKSFEEQTRSSIVQFEDDTLLRQPVARNGDDEYPEKLHETHLSTSVEEICMSLVGDVELRDGPPSEEHKEVIRDAHFEGESEDNNETSTNEMEEQPEHVNEKQSHDYKHEGFPPETSEPQEEESKVKTGHIEAELLTEQQWVAEEPYGSGNEASLTEGHFTEQMQDGNSFRQLAPTDGSKECPEESYEPDESASLNEVCTSIVQDVLIREGLVPEECSEIYKDANFKAQSQSHNKTTTYEIQEHTNVQQNDDYTHEDFQLDARESQEEDDRKVKNSHTEVEILNDEQLVDEGNSMVLNKDSLIAISCNDQLQEVRLQGQPVFRDSDEVRHKELVAIEQNTSEVVMCTSIVEEILKKGDQVSEEFNDLFKDVNLTTESESIKEIMTHEVQEHTSKIQNDDYIHEHFQPNAGESQKEDIQVRVGHIEEDISSEEQLVVHKEDSLIEVSCSDQLQEGKLQGQPVFRDSDKVCHEELVEKEQGTSEMYTSVVGHIPKGEDQVSEEFNDNLKDVSFRAESESIKEIMTHEVQKHTSIIQNDDYIHEHFQPNAGESQEEDIQVRVGHIEEEILSEEQLVVHKEDSLIEISCNDQLQQGKLQGQPVFRDIDEVCHKELVETEQGTSEMYTSVVGHIPKGEGQVSEEFSDILKDVNFRAESESIKEIITHEVQEHTSIIQNDDYIHEHSQPNAGDSKEEDIQVRVGHIEEEISSEELLVVHKEDSLIEVSSNDQLQEDRLQGQPVFRDSDEVWHKELVETEHGPSVIERHTSIVEHIPKGEDQVSEEFNDNLKDVSFRAEGESIKEIMTHEVQEHTSKIQNDDYIHEHFQPNAGESQDEDIQVRVGHIAEDIFSEEQLGVHKEDSLIEVSCNAQLQEGKLQGQPVFRDSDEVWCKELVETEQGTSVIEMHTSIVEHIPKGEDHMSEESNDILKDVSFKAEGESLKEIMTHELQEHTSIIQNDDYIHEHFQPNAGKSQEEDIQVRVGHIEEDIFSEEQLMVHKEDSLIELSCNAQLQEGKFQAQPVFRDSDEVWHKELVETEQDTSVIEMHTSIVEHIPKGEDHVSEEFKDNLKDVSLKAESESIKEIMTHEIQEHTSIIQNDDYIHEYFQTDARESQEEDIDVKIHHIEVEILNEEKFAAEEQLVVHKEDSLIEVSNNDQLQEDSLQGQPVFRDIDEVCRKETLETEQSTSVIEMCTSIVEDILKREGQVSEEFNVNLRAESESLKELMTYEVQEHTSIIENDGHEHFQPDATESQEEDTQVRTDHTEVEFLTEEQFVLKDKVCSAEGTRNDQHYEDRSTSQPVPGESNEVSPEKFHETELSKLTGEICTSSAEGVLIENSLVSEEERDVFGSVSLITEGEPHGETSTCERELQQYTDEEQNHNYIYEDSSIKTRKSQGDDSEVSSGHLEVEHLTEEQLVAEGQFKVDNDASAKDHLQEDRLLEKTFFRDSNEVSSDILHETEPRTTVYEICTSIVNDVLRDSLVSEESRESLSEAGSKEESISHSDTSIGEVIELQDHTAEEQNYDYINEVSMIETRKSQEDDSKGNTDHLEAENVTEEPFVTEKQFRVDDEASPLEGSSTGDQSQEDKLLGQSDSRDRDELCHKDLFETVQSTSVIETLTSVVEEVLITEGLVSEQCSKVIKDADFKTESISFNETTTYKIHEQRSEKQNNDYTHEEIHLDARESQEEVNRVKLDHIEEEQLVAEQKLVNTDEGSTTEGSQEEDSKVKIGHIEVECLSEEELVAEEPLVVHNEDSLTEVSCNDQLQEDRLQEQPISRYIDDVRNQELYETEQNTSMVEMYPLIVEDDLIRENLVSEEFSGVSKDVNLTSESESHNESITCEVQANMAVKLNSDYTHIDLQQDDSELQVEDSKEKIGHVDVEFLTGEQFVVTDEPWPAEGSSNDQLKEGLLREPVSRDGDNLLHKELYETELSALENEMCTSFFEDVQIKDVIGSEDHTEVLTEAGLLQESKSYRATFTCEVEEQHEHTAGENNDDHIFEVSLTETSKSQGHDNEFNTVCLEAENITKEQLVSETQFEGPNEASQIEGSSTDQLQEDGLLQTFSKESDEINNKELDGTEESASVIKLCISIADNILRDSLGSEELSGIIKETHFKAASESHNETTTCKIQEQSGEREDNDYTREESQPETNESQEEDTKFKASHTEVGFLTEEQFVVTVEAYQVEKSSNDQMQEDKLSEESLKTENKSDSEMSTCEVEDLQEHTTEEHNDNYLCEDFQIETSKSQEEDSKAKIAPTEVEFLPKEQFVVEEEFVLKNLTDENRDHTEEKHDFSNDTNKEYIKDIEDEEYEPQFEQDIKKLLKESYEDEGFSHQATNAVAQNTSTGHTIVLDTTAEQENQLDKIFQSPEKELDLLSDINSTIYSSLLDQSISVSSEGTGATLDTQKMESVLYASHITASNLDSVLEVAELADFEVETVHKSPKELDLLSEIQCMLSPDHTVRRFPELVDDLNGKVTVSTEDQSSAYAEEQASEMIKDLDSSSGSLLEDPTDHWRSTSESNEKTGKDLLLEIQSVITEDRDIKTANYFSSSVKLVESNVKVEDEKVSQLTPGNSVYETEEDVRLETVTVEEEVDNEHKVISIENLLFAHKPSQVEGDVSQHDSLFGTVVINTSVLEEAVNVNIINTSTDGENSLTRELCGPEIDINSQTQSSLIQVDINKMQSSTNEETNAIYLNEVEYENREHGIKEEYLPIRQTSGHADIARGQEKTLVDETGMSNEPAVQEEDDLDTKVPFHSFLDVSAQKSRILLLRKTSVRRRPGQRPVMLQEELADPSAIPPLNMEVTPDPESSYPTEEATEMSDTSEPLLHRKSSIRRRGQRPATFQEELAGSSALPALNMGMPPAPESSYPTEETTETSNASETLLRRKSTIRRRGPRPLTFEGEPSLPLITSAESPHPTEEPRNESTVSEQILHGKASIHPHQGQHPVAFEDEPVNASPPVIMPQKMQVPHFLGGIPILSPAVAPMPVLLHPTEEPRDEGTTSEPMLRRKSSVRRSKGKQQVTSEEQHIEPPLPMTAPPRVGVALFPGVPAHITPGPAPAPSHPKEESREEKTASEELIKPKKGFLKHAGFGGAHPGMMQELQARLHKKKPKE